MTATLNYQNIKKTFKNPSRYFKYLYNQLISKTLGNLVFMNKLIAILRMRKAFKFPIGLGVMGTNLCNTSCSFCIYPLKSIKKLKSLDFDIFKKVVFEMDQSGYQFQLGLTPSYAEPLTDPLFMERLDIIKNLKNLSYFHFTTNLISLKKWSVENILTSGVHAIHISIGGLDHKSYLRLYRVDKYSLVFENLIILLKTNLQLGCPVHIDVIVRADEPIETIKKKKDYQTLYEYKRLGVCAISIENQFDDWGGAIDLENFGLQRAKPSRVKKYACGLLYLGPAINAEKAYSLCSCKDVSGTELNFGNASMNTISDVNNYRRKIITEWEVNKRIPDVCKACNTYLDPIKFFGFNGDKASIDILNQN